MRLVIDSHLNSTDENGHGTHCAGVIAASTNNGKGIAGVAGITEGRIKIMAVKVTDKFGLGLFSWFLKGLNYALAKGARISSASLGGRARSAIGLVERVLRKNRDHLLIAAAGNEGRGVGR